MTESITRFFRGRTILPAASLVALAALATPANAYTPAEGAKILNVVTVSYEGTGGATYTANAASIVTVTLAPAALTYSGAPLAAAPGDTAAVECPPTASSGETSVAMNAVSANANGDDNYTLAINNIVPADADNETVTFRILGSDGAQLVGATTSTTLNNFGSTLIVGVQDDDTLRVDGGVNIAAMFAAGDIVVVKNGATRIDYKVVSAVNGTAVSHDNGGGGNYSTAGNTNNATAYGLLTVEAFQVTIGSVTYGSNTDPDFVASPPAAGATVGEMVLVEVSATADATSQTANGTVDFDFTTEDSGGANTTSNPCTATFTQAAQLTIQKLVSNITAGTGPANTVNGAPGDTLEYQVTVTNPDTSDAKLVVVTDVVPVYTTLVESSGNFATVAKGATTVNITSLNDNTEDGTVASGDRTATTAGSTMTFYLGDANVGTGAPAGGTIAGGESFVITYRVTIDN